MHKYYPEDFKQEVREMLADGLKPENVAWYLGVRPELVRYIQNPKRMNEANAAWRKKNRQKVREDMKLYQKRYHNGLKAKIQKYREEFSTPVS